MTFGQWLRQSRQDQCMSREALADCCQVSPRTVLSWEQGERYPRFPQFFVICRALNVYSVFPGAFEEAQ